MAAPYTSIGPYKQGVWLVVLRNGATGIMDRSHLPTAPGTRYYWLGTTSGEASSKLPQAIANMGLGVSAIPDATLIASAFKGKILGITGDWGAPGKQKVQPFQPPSTTPAPTYPGAQYPKGPSLGLGDIEQFAIQVLEGLVGVALIFLGLQALTGQGSGSPVDAVKKVGGVAVKVAK
jgi:hypothetical protein